MTKLIVRILPAAAVMLAIVFAWMLTSSPRVQANDDGDHQSRSDSRVEQGFNIAPVKLNLAGKNPRLVGLGSYIVNAQSACNDCHTWPSYAAGGDPFMGQPKQVNVAGYMAGGRLFFGPVVSRNLTPDKTGLPLGGASFEEFLSIIHTGVDPDHAHPQLGPFLQVMPWPVYQDMTDNDLRAIYEYLSTIPCIEGEQGLPNPRPVGTRCQ
jgi:hypothetical protein